MKVHCFKILKLEELLYAVIFKTVYIKLLNLNASLPLNVFQFRLKMMFQLCIVMRLLQEDHTYIGCRTAKLGNELLQFTILAEK